MKVETYKQTKEQNVKIGERLKTLRTALNLSQEEFASRICCHPFDYSRVESGIETYRASMFKLISYEFGVSLSWIMQGIPAEGDPKFCTLDSDGQRIFNSCISVQEAMWDYMTDNGGDDPQNKYINADRQGKKPCRFFVTANIFGYAFLSVIRPF